MANKNLEYSLKAISPIDGRYASQIDNELNEINSLKSTHIEKIEEKDKEIFLHNIINNIRLLNLIKERELVKKELLSNNDNSSKNLILRFQNLNNEINKIQNKKID